MAKETKDVKEKEKKVCTPEFRVSFPNMFKPRAAAKGAAEKYSVSMLFSNTTDLKSVKQLAFAAAKAKWGPKEQWPEGFRMPWSDGNLGKNKSRPGYKDTIVVKASSKFQPELIGKNGMPITEESKRFYAGCFAVAMISAWAYDTAGNAGVSFNLESVMKMRDGDKLGDTRSAAESFKHLIEEDNDEEASEDDSETSEEESEDDEYEGL